MSKVSVIIPTWNRANTIERAIISALNQTIPDLEVLVCDDGSTDNTFEIVNSIKDPRVKWISGEHSGMPAVPRNRGIKQAKGEWIAFLDSDDEWLPEKLEKQLTIAKESCSMAVAANAYRLMPGKGISGVMVKWDKKTISFDDLVKENHVVCSSAFIHISFFKKNVGFPEDPHLKAIEDYALWVRVATECSFSFIHEPLLIYTDDPVGSVRNEGFDDGLLQRTYVLNNFIRWCNTRKDLKPYYAIAARKHLLRNSFLTILKPYIFLARTIRQQILGLRDNISVKSSNELEIVTIAFNNDDVIRHQIKLIRKNLLDNYRYTVADNSTDPGKRARIFNICKECDVPYIKLKPYSGLSPSVSHGMALNWIYRNYIRVKKPHFFGFIDHDIFPVTPHSIAAYLKESPVYGHMQQRALKGRDIWYLWAGFCFFDYDFVKNRKLDFTPTKGLDTGGRNWKSLYSHLNKYKIKVPQHRYEKFLPNNNISKVRDFYEYIGDWVHVFDASNWLGTSPGEIEERQRIVEELLKKYY